MLKLCKRKNINVKKVKGSIEIKSIFYIYFIQKIYIYIKHVKLII